MFDGRECGRNVIWGDRLCFIMIYVNCIFIFLEYVNKIFMWRWVYLLCLLVNYIVKFND